MSDVMKVKCKGCHFTFFTAKSNKLYCEPLCGERYRNQLWRTGNKEAIRKKNLKYNSNVPNRILIRTKYRAKKAGIPFNLEIEDIKVPEQCPVLGIKLQTVAGAGANQISSPSLDRIDPERGYTKGNVRVISQRANLLKSNASVEELTLVLEDLKCLEFTRST